MKCPCKQGLDGELHAIKERVAAKQLYGKDCLIIMDPDTPSETADPKYLETSGLEGDGAIGNAWRYRDWVMDPYDHFVVKQIAGGDEHSKTRNNYAPDIQGQSP